MARSLSSTAVLTALAVQAAPQNPLGDGCLAEQYASLNDPTKVTLAYDVSDPSNEYRFDYKNPPSLLSLAKQEVGAAWTAFLSSTCNTTPQDGMPWAGECRKATSKLRDTLSLFVNVYPTGGQYDFDPWWVVQEDVAHRGYYLAGDYLDQFGVAGNEAQKAAKFALLRAWYDEWRSKVGSDGKKIIGGADHAPTYDQYVRLEGPVSADGSNPTDSSPFTQRPVLDQFWGNDGDMASPSLGAFENLGYLFRIVHSSALDGPSKVLDARWKEVFEADDLTLNVAAAGAAPHYRVADEFHELRKQVRAMWRNLQNYPQIMPAAWYTLTVDGAGGKIPLWSWDVMLTKTVDGHDMLKAFFDNDQKHTDYFKSWGWPDEAIWLGTSLALGGYFHIDQEPVDDLSMIGSQHKFDFVERMGWINDELMTYKYGVSAGKSADWQAAQRTKINTLWSYLKGWFVRNDVHQRLREVVEYLPSTACTGSAINVKTLNPIVTQTTAPVGDGLASGLLVFVLVPIVLLAGAGIACVYKRRSSAAATKQMLHGSDFSDMP